MLVRSLIPAVLLLVGGCTAAPPTDALSVVEVRDRIHTLNGTAVVVRGWLGICSGNDCGLYQTLDDAKLVADGDHLSDAWAAAMDKRLSIGTDTYFDMVAYHLQFKEVVIRGTVNDHCRNGITFCFDRAGDIDPETIQFII